MLCPSLLSLFYLQGASDFFVAQMWLGFGGFVCLIFDKYLLEVMAASSVEFTGSRADYFSSRPETSQAAEGMQGFMYVLCLITLTYVLGCDS